MNIYIRSNEEVINVLGGFQKRTNHKKVRYSTLCVIADVDDGKAIYNELTKSLVFLTQNDYDVVTKKENEGTSGFQYLFSNYFLVPENFNELETAQKVKGHFLAKMTDDIRYSNITTYTILPTTDCNARCFYCYQKGIEHKNMTKETASKIVKFIIDRHAPNKDVYLRWFGGEPLYNVDIIDFICAELKKAKISFRSNLVSNSYLFTPELAKRAVNEWNLKHLQITLDGTEETYNKAKHYIYKDGESPFWRVINNCKGALDCGINVGIRLNVDNYNIEDMKGLLDILFEKFGNRLTVSIFPLFESSMKERRTVEDRKKLYEKVYEVEDKAVRLGLLRHSVHEKYQQSMCIVDDGRSILFQPDGSIGLCEHYADEDKLSHIDTLVYDEKGIKAWLEKCKPDDGLCDDCPLMPSCVRVKKCPEESVCNDQIKARKIRNEKFGVINLYRSQRYLHDMQRQNNNVKPIEIHENGIYTAPNNITGYNPVIVKVEHKEPYKPTFVVVRDKNTLCVTYLEENLEYFPELTKEEFVEFFNTHTNIGLNTHISIDDVSVVKGKNTWFEIDMILNPKLRLADAFEWNGGEFCNGCLHLTNGATKIFKW